MNMSSQPLRFVPDASSQSRPSADNQASNAPIGIPPTPAPATAGPSRVRRRNRMITSCLECRRRKLKCDKSHPCTNCTKNSRDCVFLAPALDSASQLRLTEIKEKMGSLERVLEQDVARKGARQKLWKAEPDSDQIDFAPEPEDEKDLEPTPLAVSDAVYDDDADDDLADLGFAMGRMRLSDRIGGFFRPKMAEELTVSLNDEPGDSKASSRKSLSPEQPIPYFVPKLPSNNFLAPGPTYIAPSSSFLFASGQSSASLINFLPSKTIADRLLNQYWIAVHPLCRIVHKPSFQRRYRAFWADVEVGIEPTGSLQAVIFAALFSGVVSLADDAVLMGFGTTKKELVDNFQMGTETALGRANVIRTTKIETLQALVMYMIPLCRGEISRSHSALVGTALRIAECMGLHRDGTEYGFGPVETHVRRMIWYQICFLDIRTCEAQGPRPHIRADEFDTQLPLNVDDEELEGPEPATESASRWTDMTLSLIRMECNDICRVVWIDRVRLEKKKISLTAVLGKIENFRKMMKEKYLSLINDSIPVQRLGRHVCEICSLRMHIMILHRYHNSVAYQIPDRLNQIIINSGTECMERSIEIETAPAFRLWAWYSSAYAYPPFSILSNPLPSPPLSLTPKGDTHSIQQYHSALLLLMEVFAFPTRKEADRIWRCLDYVFEIPPHIPSHQKGRWVLTEVRDKMGIYIASRKVMAPASMLERIEGYNTSRSGSLASGSPPPPTGQGQALGQGQAVGKMREGSGDLSFGGYPPVAISHQYAQRQPDQMPYNGGTEAQSMAMPVVPAAPAPGQGEKMLDIDWVCVFLSRSF
ncbi:MAG: hypothetical protein Q9220_000522 [cf. Caloplaca sp. 1 TL-2023]